MILKEVKSKWKKTAQTPSTTGGFLERNKDLTESEQEELEAAAIEEGLHLIDFL